MEYPINCPGFDDGALVVRTAGVFSGAKVLLNGVALKPKKDIAVVQDNNGKEVQIRINTHYIDPVPSIQIGDETLDLVRPLTWYEYVWMGLPILLMHAGGSLGGMLGLGAAYINTRIIRGSAETKVKYIQSGAVSLGAALCYLGASAGLMYALNTYLPSPAVKISSGITAYKNKQYDEAVLDFSKAIELDPNSYDAYMARSRTYMAKGDYAKAIDDQTRMITLNPKGAYGYSSRMSAYLRLGKFDKALEDCSKIISLVPNNPDAYTLRAEIYGMTKDYDKAIEDYSKVIELDPKHGKAYAARAAVYVAMGEPEMAAADQEKAKSLPQE